ncbi:hypothetical protein CAEBREN_02926 [Caenorhabditis brenneri]|uniref:Uncharacterized protein n=1 Tax=Caenorhabditis brenneri TaxID=135651 RepID=G0PDK5_CAEBE|nr:hypothetical protein CAEBREN_02926 [Caenorhabditis brenneri]
MDLEQVIRDVRDRIEENAHNFSLDFLAAAWHHLHQIRDAFQQIVVEGRAANLRIDPRAGGGENPLAFDPRTVLLAMARLRELDDEPMRRAMRRVLDQIREILRTLDIYVPFNPEQPRHVVRNRLMQEVPGIIAPHHRPEVVDFMAMMGQDVALAHLGQLRQQPMAARPRGNDIQRMVRNNLMHIAGRNRVENVAEQREVENIEWSDDEMEDEMEDEEVEDEELEDIEEDEDEAPAAEVPEEAQEEAAEQAPAIVEAPPAAVPAAPMDAEEAAAMVPAAAAVDVAHDPFENLEPVPEAPREEDAAQGLVELAGEPNAPEQPAPAQPAGFPILHEPIPRDMPLEEQERHVLELLNRVENNLGERMVEQMEVINRMMLDLDVVANQVFRRDDDLQVPRAPGPFDVPDDDLPAHPDLRAFLRGREFRDILNPFRRAVDRARAGDQGALDRAERERQRAQQAVDEDPADFGRRRMLFNWDRDAGLQIRARRLELEERQRARRAAQEAPPAPRGILRDRRPPMRPRGIERFREELDELRDVLRMDDDDDDEDEDEDDIQEPPAKRSPESEQLHLPRGSLDFVRWKAEKVLQWVGLFIKNQDYLEFMEYKHYNGRQLFRILDSYEKWLDEKIPFGLYCKMAANMNRLMNEHNGYLYTGYKK